MRVAIRLAVAAVLVAGGPAPADEKKDARFDADKLAGKWDFVSGQKPGEKLEADRLKDQSVEFTKDTLTLKGPAGTFVMKYKVDATKSPAAISLEITEAPFGAGTKSEGILEFDGDKLKFCYADPGEPAPKSFEVKEKDKARSFVLKKAK
jgi:uncharacterized protein (TIGR03067 family)